MNTLEQEYYKLKYDLEQKLKEFNSNHNLRRWPELQIWGEYLYASHLKKTKLLKKFLLDAGDEYITLDQLKVFQEDAAKQVETTTKPQYERVKPHLRVLSLFPKDKLEVFKKYIQLLAEEDSLLTAEELIKH